jgi:malonate-semialdehyde dehydrogenase (acetylating)/methylmalonate-semialdehyde dehydrogenase
LYLAARKRHETHEPRNPQKRARVMMKFVELLHRDMDKLAEALSREHGKTLPDAKGDVIRGLEVANSALARRIC